MLIIRECHPWCFVVLAELHWAPSLGQQVWLLGEGEQANHVVRHTIKFLALGAHHLPRGAAFWGRNLRRGVYHGYCVVWRSMYIARRPIR